MLSLESLSRGSPTKEPIELEGATWTRRIARGCVTKLCQPNLKVHILCDHIQEHASLSRQKGYLLALVRVLDKILGCNEDGNTWEIDWKIVR